jgi:hypothetical protein
MQPSWAIEVTSDASGHMMMKTNPVPPPPPHTSHLPLIFPLHSDDLEDKEHGGNSLGT